MSNTPNLDLEMIEVTDNIKTTFLNKLNSNNEKIDSAYKVLVDNLLENTNKDNLTDAIEEVNNSYSTIDNLNNTIGNLNSTIDTLNNDINEKDLQIAELNEQVAELIKNTLPKVNIEVAPYNENDYTSHITGYWGAINERGELIISAMSGGTSYEHIRFIAKSIGVGTAGSGFGITGFDTSDPANLPHSCIVTGIDITQYQEINVSLQTSTANATNDYVALQVIITGS